MINIYDSDDKLFSNNGIKVLHPIKCEVYKKDNGDYYIDLVDKIENIAFYQSNMIITCPTPFPEGVQAFRITKIERNNSKLSLRAKHIYFDTSNYIIQDSYIVDKNCGYALDHLNSNCDVKTPFNTSSDITVNNTYRCVRTSLEEAISVIIERWGGHLVRNNFKIEINSKIGTDRGITLRYGKNIKDIKAEEDWSNVCTKILPVGKGGLLLPEKFIAIDEEIYKIPFTKVVSFTQNLSEEDYDSVESYNQALLQDLRNQSISFLNENKFPKVNYSLSAHLEEVTDVGDTIYVKHPKLKLDLITNVISVKWDAISKKYKNIEFGNFKNSLKDLIKNVNNSTSQIAKEISENTKIILEQELKEATNKILGMMGNSYVIYDGDKILVVDKLPKEKATNVMIINSGGIGFSTNGINGTFNSAWTIDGTLDMKSINVINLVADMIKGGTLKLGGENNTNGSIEIYNKNSELIGKIDNNGVQLKFGDNLNTVESQIGNVKNEINDDIKTNYYDKNTINNLVISSAEGISNTFSESGGNNIFRNTGLWFKNDGEDSKKDKTIIGSNIKLFDAIDKTVNNVRINGYTRQITTTGDNFYTKDFSNVSSFVKEEDNDWFSYSYDHSAGTATTYSNLFTKASDLLKINTEYYCVVELKDVEITGNVTMMITDGTYSYEQFKTGFKIEKDDLQSKTIVIKELTTKDNFDGTTLLLRSFFTLRAGSKISLKFRISLRGKAQTEDNFVYEPYTNGIPSPSPDFPQEVEVVRGNNILPTDISDWEQGTLTTQGANSNNTTRIRTIDYYSIKTGIDYYISVEATNYSFVNIFLYDKNKTFVVSYASIFNISGTRGTKINIPSSYDVSYMRVILQKSNATTITADEVETIKPMITKGSTKIDFEPYNSIIAKSNGKNLFDKDNVKNGLISINSNTDTVIESNTVCISDRMFVVGGNNYTFTKIGSVDCYIFEFDKDGNKTNVTYSDLNTFINVIKLNNNTSYVRIRIDANEVDNYDFQLEEGTIATECKPYQESKLTYSLNDNFLAEQDYIQDNKLYKNVAKLVLDGSENGWEYNSTYKYFRCPNYDYGIDIPLDLKGTQKCNYFQLIDDWGTFRDNIDKNGIFRINNEGYKICIRNTACNTVEEWKQWLSEHPVEVYYQLEAPTTIDLEPIGELKTFDGTTYMSNNVGTDMEVNYKAIYSLYEYWIGKATRKTNEKAVNSNSIVIQKGSFIQEQEVPDGIYSICFKYKKLIQLAKTKVKINDFEYDLSSLEDKEFYTGEKDNETGEYITQPLEVSSRHINIEFISDTNNAIEIYDLMCNKGNVKLAYSQNQNETTTDTVNISKGITITSSNIDVVFRANADGIRLYTLQGEVKTRFTDKGMSTKEAIIEDEAQICGTLIQEIDDQTWWTRM